MASLKGTKTEENLKQALAAESQASTRYLFFAQTADVDGHPEIATLFRSLAEGETGHAFGLFEFLSEVGDPATGLPVESTEDNLRSAIAHETREFRDVYPEFARTARNEGLNEVADWMESLARAEEGNAERLAAGLEGLAQPGGT